MWPEAFENGDIWVHRRWFRQRRKTNPKCPLFRLWPLPETPVFLFGFQDSGPRETRESTEANRWNPITANTTKIRTSHESRRAHIESDDTTLGFSEPTSGSSSSRRYWDWANRRVNLAMQSSSSLSISIKLDPHEATLLGTSQAKQAPELPPLLICFFSEIKSSSVKNWDGSKDSLPCKSTAIATELRWVVLIIQYWGCCCWVEKIR